MVMASQEQEYLAIHKRGGAGSSRALYSAVFLEGPRESDEFPDVYIDMWAFKGEHVEVYKISAALVDALQKPIEGLIKRLNAGEEVHIPSVLEQLKDEILS